MTSGSSSRETPITVTTASSVAEPALSITVARRKSMKRTATGRAPLSG